jgi:uroporphyrinogen III methyltransferase/synthase
VFKPLLLRSGSTQGRPGVYIGPMNTAESVDAAIGSRPLIGRTLVVTRAAAQAEGLVDALEALGARVVRLPAIRIEPPVDQRALQWAVLSAAEYEWVIFTSANGVDFFRTAAEDVGIDAKGALASTRLCCVGPATASAIEALGLMVEVIPETHRAEAVVDALSARTSLRGRRILIPTVAEARPVLRDGLREQGAEVDTVTAYRTLSVEYPDLGALGQIEEGVDLVTFTSPSTVRSFHRLVGGEVVADAAVIGPLTADAARGLGYRVAVEADPFTIPGLVEAILSHLEGAQHG